MPPKKSEALLDFPLCRGTAILLILHVHHLTTKPGGIRRGRRPHRGLLNLTPQQRRSLPKISTQDRALATDALAVVTNNSDFMAKSFSVPDFQEDVDFFTALSGLYLKLQPFLEKLDDTMLATRSDLDNQMRDVYGSAKRNNVTSGMDALTAYFGQRYRRQSTPKTSPPTT